MRLYTTVLHLHISVSSSPSGPEYEFWGSKAGMLNAPLLHAAAKYAVTKQGLCWSELNDQAKAELVQFGALTCALAGPMKSR